MKNAKKVSARLRLLAALLGILLLSAAFSGCGKKEKPFELPVRNALDETRTYGYYDYVLYDTGDAALVAYAGNESSVTVPAEVDGHPVVTLGEGLFGDHSEIRSIRLPDGLEVVSDFCFYGCSALTDLGYGKKLWSIGVKALDGTAWMAAQSGDFVTINGTLVEYHGQMKAVVVPEEIRHIGGGAFSMNNDVLSVELAENTYTVGAQAFAFCGSLVSVSFGSALLSIGQSAFGGCENLKMIDLPATTQIIGVNAFTDCYNLHYACLGSSLTEIGDGAFYYCQRLTTVCLPDTLEELHTTVFEDCFSFSLVLYGGSAERFASVTVNDDNYVYDWTKLNVLYNCDFEGR